MMKMRKMRKIDRYGWLFVIVSSIVIAVHINAQESRRVIIRDTVKVAGIRVISDTSSAFRLKDYSFAWFTTRTEGAFDAADSAFANDTVWVILETGMTRKDTIWTIFDTVIIISLTNTDTIVNSSVANFRTSYRGMWGRFIQTYTDSTTGTDANGHASNRRITTWISGVK